MTNVVIPMAGLSSLAGELEYPYPSPLVEINGSPLIELAIRNLQEFGESVSFTAILRAEDCKRFHLDNTLRVLTDGRVNIVKLQRDTGGALCSILMAVEHFNEDEPLIIANSDQIFDDGVLADFASRVDESGAAAACLVFQSVHPRWSYLRISDGFVIEAVEKNPVSRHAIAGIYYFRSGRAFAERAMRAIINGRDTEGVFFTSAVLNEYVLDGLNVVPIVVRNEAFHSMFTAQRVLDYERRFLRD